MPARADSSWGSDRADSVAEQAHRSAYAPPVEAPVPSSAAVDASEAAGAAGDTRPGSSTDAGADAEAVGHHPAYVGPVPQAPAGESGGDAGSVPPGGVPLTDARRGASTRPRQAGRCRGRPVPALRRHRRRRRSARAGPHPPRRHDAARTRAGRHAAPGRIGRQHRRRGAAQHRHDQGRRGQRGFGDGLRLRHRRQGTRAHQQPCRRARRQRRHRDRAEQRRHREGHHRRA